MNTHRLVVTLTLCLAVAGAHAADDDLDCKRPDLGQQGMNQCAYQAFNVQDRELNKLYGKLLKQQDADSARQLQAAQRAWIQFRDLECVFESPDAPGSLGPLEKATCMTELTKARITDLKRSLR